MAEKATKSKNDTISSGMAGLIISNNHLNCCFFPPQRTQTLLPGRKGLPHFGQTLPAGASGFL